MKMNNSDQEMEEESVSDNFFIKYQKCQHLCDQIR